MSHAQVDPAHRISAKEAVDHPFLRGIAVDHQTLLATTGNVLEMMRAFNAERRFRRAVFAVVAAANIALYLRPSLAARLRPMPGSSISSTAAAASSETSFSEVGAIGTPSK